jgi:hypothetical protein
LNIISETKFSKQTATGTSKKNQPPKIAVQAPTGDISGNDSFFKGKSSILYGSRGPFNNYVDKKRGWGIRSKSTGGGGGVT